MGAPKGNKNAEKWDLETSTDLFNKAIEMSKNQDYDFIGEIAYDLDLDKGIFDHIIERFPELKPMKQRLLANCEVNCYRNVKKEKINVAVGIINLKSNHKWTDRQEVDHTTKGDKLETPNIIVNTPDVAKAFEELKQMFEDETDNDV